MPAQCVRASAVVLRVCTLILCSVLLVSCSDSVQNTLDTPTDVRLAVPSNFPPIRYNLAANQISTDGFILGRTLFYDGTLSRDGTVSCGSCHQQSSAFTHHGHDLSHGIDDKLGNRNSPPVMNLAWQPHFFWDGGVHDLDLFSIAPIENPVEMDEKLDNVLAKLRSSPKYRSLFAKAFGSEDISTSRFLKALSQFMLMCVSSQSRYDSFVRHEGAVLSERERLGRTLFSQKCGACHSTDLFTDFSFRNNGLEQRTPFDSGRARITLQHEDIGKFKVPSVRNIALTAPYMHDGRIRTLEGVLNHYRFGMKVTPNIDSFFIRQGKNPGIDMTDNEAQLIIEFLHTLTDTDFTTRRILSEQ
ncbi:MAG: cytochrome-c peroxidase [Candidatus Kapabacteria bacterium]|nr:cytochrome-c peroxidase [Candidatus Kapabacteria bacterium]